MSVSLIHRPHTVTRPSKRRAVCDRLDAVRTTMWGERLVLDSKRPAAPSPLLPCRPRPLSDRSVDRRDDAGERLRGIADALGRRARFGLAQSLPSSRQDFENLSHDALAFLQLASIRLILRKLWNPAGTFRTASTTKPIRRLSPLRLLAGAAG